MRNWGKLGQSWVKHAKSTSGNTGRTGVQAAGTLGERNSSVGCCAAPYTPSPPGQTLCLVKFGQQELRQKANSAQHSCTSLMSSRSITVWAGLCRITILPAPHHILSSARQKSPVPLSLSNRNLSNTSEWTHLSPVYLSHFYFTCFASPPLPSSLFTFQLHRKHFIAQMSLP